MAEAATRRPPSPLQLYAVSRLAGRRGSQWLDAQTLEQAVRATEQLGVLVEFGPLRGSKTLTVGRSVAAAMTRLVHVIKLPKALGCSRPQATGLIEDRILTQIATGEAGTPGRTQKSVDRRDIDAFLSALMVRARLVDALPLGYVPIAEAAKKVKVPCVDIVHLVLGGFLEKVVSPRDLDGYAAIHVQPSELAQVIGKVLTGFAPSQAAAKIGFPAETFWALIDENGETPAELPSVTVQPRAGHHIIRRVDLDDFTRFRAQFVKSSDIANHLEVPRALVERDLRRYRVPSAYSAAQIGVALYRVEDLPAKLRSIRVSEVA
ncbi:hypothetical protein [Loktanella sp. SALINAS62]|uniref:hypothetical protein n=1 Tax=Loktanella sp. SALINAS62 TaxID=2706124 RepID=UPI0020131E79|nr:hypothetical protein [Loktanella sp. SALINAS62]